MKQILKPRDIVAIMAVLEHYAAIDDAGYNLLRGFKAKAGDHDPNSPARRALNIIKDKVGYPS